MNLNELLQQPESSIDYTFRVLSNYFDSCASSDQLAREFNHKKVSKFLQDWQGKPEIKPLLISVFEGVTLFYSTSFHQAVEVLKKAEKDVTENTPSDLKGIINWALGISARSLGWVDQAFEHQIKAVSQIAPEGPFSTTYGFALYQLGELHLYIDEFETARTYYEKGLKILKNSDNTTALFRIQNGLGNCLLHLEEFKQAFHYFDQSLKLKNLSYAEQGRGLCDLGRYYIATQEIDTAKKVILRSLEVRENAQLEDASSTSLILLGECELLLGHIDESISAFSKANEIVEKYQSSGKQIQIYKGLAQGFEAKKEVQKAIEFYKKYEKLYQNTKNEQEKRIFKLKNTQIEQQRQELEKNNTLLRETLNEVARLKRSRKSIIFSVITALFLVLLTEILFDPVIESMANNQYLSLAVKGGIALLLKPMETFYERLLVKKLRTEPNE